MRDGEVYGYCTLCKALCLVPGCGTPAKYVEECDWFEYLDEEEHMT